MTGPTIHDVFDFLKARQDHPVSWFELRSAWPYVKPGKLRALCCRLERQGYIVRPSFDIYQFKVSL